MTGEMDLLDVDDDRWTEVGPDQWTCTGSAPGPLRRRRADIERQYGPVVEVLPRRRA